MVAAPLPFAGSIVLELQRNGGSLCVGLAVSFAAKIAAELGASVFKLEPQGGDPVRSLGPWLAGDSASALYEFVNTGKTIAAGSQAGQDFNRLLPLGVSVVIGEEGDPRLDLVCSRGIPTVSVTDWPATWTGARPPLTEFTVLALSGVLDMIGEPDREPLRLGGHQASYTTGLAAFTALSVMLTARSEQMPTEHIRVSLLETMLWVNWKAVAGAEASGVPPSRRGAKAEFQVLSCRDGWVALVFSVAQFDAVIKLIGDPALRDPKFATREGRIDHAQELYASMASWFAARSRVEIQALAQSRDVPLGPVYEAAELLDDPQYVARDFVATVPHPALGNLRLPRLPVCWGQARYAPALAVETSSEDLIAALGSAADPGIRHEARQQQESGDKAMRPLDRVRVIDFGQLTAGANTAAMLADLGADVIKVESSANLDLFRIIGSVDRDEGWWNRSAPFRFSNRNKRGITIDLKTDEGKRLIRLLIDQSHVVVENFRRGVLERLGIDFASISAGNPRIILASISSQGETGPQRLHASFGSTLDATGGMSALTGYAGGKPEISGTDVNYPDQIVSLFATGMIVAAVKEVRRTGQGVLLDISQREIASFLVGEEFVAAGSRSVHEAALRRGNAEPGVYLQDCFRDRAGRWLAVTVTDAAAADRLASVLGRGEAAEELRQGLAAWTAARDAGTAAADLAAAGVSAAPVLDGMDLLRDPALLGATVAKGLDGSLVKGMPYTIGNGPFRVTRPAPKLGEHTAEVLREVLHLPAEEIEQLETLGVTRATPAAG